MVVEIQFGRSSSMEGTHLTQVRSGRLMVLRGSDRNIWCGSMEDYKEHMADFQRQCKDKVGIRYASFDMRFFDTNLETDKLLWRHHTDGQFFVNRMYKRDLATTAGKKSGP
ncbi:hypothetical protein H5410_012745 [Solanum commersonii]|uniref:Uncharacterized protein n=1 Tax=Solanum commersonii TaxID=4109 RepID=A0A9J6ATQ3_SOLCO|nr:hypothetical protein H5410_012745 [Solanum commersonii]